LDQQGADSGRSMVVLRVMRSRRIGLRLSRPAPPAREREYSQEHAETIPALLQTLLEQQRHQRARRGDAEPDARKDHAADDAAPRGRSVRQNDGGRQHYDDSSGEAGQEAPAYAAVASAVAGRGVARMYSYQVAEQVARGELEIVLAGDEDPEMPAHLICPQGRLSVPKVRAFTDFAVPRLKKHFAQLKKSIKAR
jgi:DNA-binding transcriptional LysR family regulator